MAIRKSPEKNSRRQPSKNSKSHRGMGLAGKLLIIFGLICFFFAIYLVWQRNDPNRLTFKNYTDNYKNYTVKNPPVRIIITDVHIDLPLFPAKLQNRQWDTTTDGASYLVTSAMPGEIGNGIIYGHDWASLFGPLVNIQPDMNIAIEYKDKTRKKFTVIKTTIVSADNSSVLEQTPDKRITLYTCTGFLDLERFVIVAIYREDLK